MWTSSANKSNLCPAMQPSYLMARPQVERTSRSLLILFSQHAETAFSFSTTAPLEHNPAASYAGHQSLSLQVGIGYYALEVGNLVICGC
ncbi:MAG: hypothetical protein CV081_03520 [Nitrospira sp. LK265]|nr:hypothetical protein [Nitrospira sp. LK265]